MQVIGKLGAYRGKTYLYFSSFGRGFGGVASVCIYAALTVIGKMAGTRRAAVKPSKPVKKETACGAGRMDTEPRGQLALRSDATAQLPEYCAAMLKR